MEPAHSYNEPDSTEPNGDLELEQAHLDIQQGLQGLSENRITETAEIEDKSVGVHIVLTSKFYDSQQLLNIALNSLFFVLEERKKNNSRIPQGCG